MANKSKLVIVELFDYGSCAVLFVLRDDVIEGCYVSCNHHHHLQVRHDDIVEHVSSILKSNGIAHSGESIDTGKLESKDLLSAEASRKGTKSIDHPCNPIKSMGNLGSMSSESRRMLYTVASMSRKVFKRT
uniref:Uncharacterized protein n=1 Tax=Oryza meridionalis TaxID=40149 RepID=A0A0E0F1M6_9ORYZ